jgi:hypothetical protein
VEEWRRRRERAAERVGLVEEKVEARRFAPGYQAPAAASEGRREVAEGDPERAARWGMLKGPHPAKLINGGAGICTYAASVSKVIASGAFLAKLLMGITFDVFIHSSGLRSSDPKSTAFVEA